MNADAHLYHIPQPLIAILCGYTHNTTKPQLYIPFGDCKKGAKSLQRILCVSIYVYVGAGSGGFLLLLLIATVCCCRKYGKRKLVSKQNVYNQIYNDNIIDFDDSGGNDDDVQLLDLDLLPTATSPAALE